MKVMIVDDIPLMLRSLELMLSRNGFEVVTANGGKTALNLLSTDLTIDVVVTDLMMKPMDGIELYRKAQKVERFNDLGVVPPPPFVLMTACERIDEKSDACRIGMVTARKEFAGHVHIPVRVDDLIPILNEITKSELVST